MEDNVRRYGWLTHSPNLEKMTLHQTPKESRLVFSSKNRTTFALKSKTDIGDMRKTRELMALWIPAAMTLLLLPVFVESRVRHYHFNVAMKNTTKLCSSKPIVTVNGQFPGPTLRAREGDSVLVNVSNHVNNNITIHWHGIRQLRTGWADGPAYIAQCPIQQGQSYVYNFTITGQRGTLFWHAHISWLRATVHGAIVILPKRNTPYPFPKPDKQETIILGEWWKADTEAVINQATQSGFPPNISDAHTFNGITGPVRNCSTKGTYTLHVESGKAYLLRIINAAVNDELFFKIANHNLTVVEVDASYTKPFTTDTIYISPGQTTNALLTANQPPTKYLITVSSFMDAPVLVDNLTNYAILRYNNNKSYSLPQTLHLTAPPSITATSLQSNYTSALRSLDSQIYPANVPLALDYSLFFTIGVGVDACATCANGSALVGAINNVTFVMPTIALLQAHYYNVSGVFTDDFPATPPVRYDYTGHPPANLGTMKGTRVFRLRFNSTVQIVLQDTAMIAPESHPMHLHGGNFYVVGKGVGNFKPGRDESRFNLVDPIERNTVDVPTGGWAAIRFWADNPGVWFMHCHLEVHTSWGLKMAFLVDNGIGPNESLHPPPNDIPKC